ncbi:MAG: hypothetical protein AB1778_09285 [Candidatus Bipolaricaulota bacterium]
MARRRRGLRILLGVLLALVLLAGGLAVALRLTSPPPPEAVAQAPAKPIPEEWTAPSDMIEVPTPVVAEGRAAWSTTGTVLLLSNDKPFGEETYELDVGPDGASLSSSGRFWFRILVATVRVSFTQSWAGGKDLEPREYSAHFDAPLGQSQTLQAAFAAESAAVRRNGDEETFPVPLDEAVVLGTFSSYAFLPVLFRERHVDGRAEFSALLFGGPPGAAAPSAEGLPRLVMERDGEGLLTAGEARVAAERYILESPLGTSELYAKGHEMLALVAGTADRRLFVYRSDYFPTPPKIGAVPPSE